MNKLQELISDRIDFVESVADWKEGIRLSAAKLLADECVEPRYIEAMIDAVEQIGPYMVLTDGLVMPHSRPESGVKKMGMAFLRVNQGVLFPDTEVPVKFFFTLASTDSNSHLEAMMKLAELADDAHKYAQFDQIKSKDEFIKLIS